MDFHRFLRKTVFKVTGQLIQSALKVIHKTDWLYQKEYIFGRTIHPISSRRPFLIRNRNDIAVVIIKRPIAASDSKSLTVTHNRIRSSPVRNLDHPV